MTTRFNHIADLYEKTAMPSLAASTRAAYHRRLRWLRKRFGSRDVGAISRADVLAAQSALAKKPAASDQTCAVLHLVLELAVQCGEIRANPAHKLRRLSSPSSRRVWTDEEIAATLAAASPDLRLALKGYLSTAMRRSDLIALPRKALVDGVLTFSARKTGSQHHIPLRAELVRELAEFAPESPWLFPMVDGRQWTENALWRALQDATEGVGKGLTIHGLRHTVLSRMVESGANLRQAQAISGHSRIESLAIYLRQAETRKLGASAAEHIDGWLDGLAG